MVFTKKWFVNVILAVAIIIPIIMVKNHVFPWSESIAKLKEIYPSDVYIDIGGSTKWSSSSGTTKIRNYLLLPSFKMVKVTLQNEDALLVKEKKQSELWYLFLSFIILAGLFVFVVIPYYRNQWKSE